MNSKKLKPCPFCGGDHVDILEDRVNGSDSFGMFFIDTGNFYEHNCKLVKFGMCRYITREDAIAHWNSRPVETRQRRDLLKQKHALMRENSELKSVLLKAIKHMEKLHGFMGSVGDYKANLTKDIKITKEMMQ